MKKPIIIAALAALCCAFNASADDNGQIVKTGYSYGPLPAISFDSDKGFQYGALLQLYNYGDGSSYPMYKSKWYFEISAFTKGSQMYTIMYDKIELFPGVRFCATAKYMKDSAYDFYGFNGYNSNVDRTGAFYFPTGVISNPEILGMGFSSENLPYFSPFYKLKRDMFFTRADFIGEITPHLHWMAGYHLHFFKQGTVNFDNLNKGKKDESKYYYTKTLLDYYTDWGIIPEDEKNGGVYSCLRAGIEYDTRDKEGAPTRGIWADAHVNIAPKWLGSSSDSYRYSLTWRQYFPLIGNDVLTFAYRLNWEGTFGNHVPYYILPYLTVVGCDNDVDGMGGSKTCRGIVRGRVLGLDTGLYTAELRWRFFQKQMFNQNIALGLNLFSDGAMAFRGVNTAYNPVNAEGLASKGLYDLLVTGKKDTPHISVGAGFRFIMNENFIIALDYGMPISKFYKEGNPLKGQDGDGGMYIGLGYLF